MLLHSNCKFNYVYTKSCFQCQCFRLDLLLPQFQQSTEFTASTTSGLTARTAVV